MPRALWPPMQYKHDSDDDDEMMMMMMMTTTVMYVLRSG
jgi:hypothetical protein